MENKFEKEGITFELIGEERVTDVLDFLWENFIPDEPISRSLGFSRNWLIDEAFFKAGMKKNCGIVALDALGNVIGARLGKVVKRSNWSDWMIDMVIRMVLPRLTWILPEALTNLWIVILLNKTVDYDVWKMFDILSCDTIYEDKLICSSRSSGVRGLGTELVKHGEALAQSLGCQYTYAIVTGNYSKCIFDNLGYSALNHLEYAKFRSPGGQLYLTDTREHVGCTTYVKTCTEKMAQ